MLMIEQRVGGLLCYRKVYFPRSEEALDISRTVKWNEVVRLFGVLTDLGQSHYLVKHEKTLTVFVNLSSGPESIMRGMKKKSCRYEIRRAEKMLNRVIVETQSERAIKDFVSVYNDFAEDKGPVPRLSVQKLREYLANGELFVLYLDGRPLCGHMLLCDPQAGIVKVALSGSRRLESRNDATDCGALNRYLHWYEMLHFHALGFLTYDFGGIRYPEHPTARFKLSFGGTIVQEHYYVFSGSRRIARLGNFVYERLLGRRIITSKIETPVTSSPPVMSTESEASPARSC